MTTRIVFNVKLALIVFCILWIVSTITAQEVSCRIPNGDVGTCISIKSCQPIIDIIKAEESSTLPQSTIEVLRSYQCGIKEKSVKVCCPSGPIQIKPSVNPRNLPAPDVSTHRNLNLLPTDCGLQAYNGDRISGGTKAELFEFPWMALLSYRIGGDKVDFRCDGTIINNRYILTAAHCITDLFNKNLELLGVRVGEYNIASEGDCESIALGESYCAPPVQDIAFVETIPHPGYLPSKLLNDIGLIRLRTPMNISIDSVKPICLPTTNALTNIDFVGTDLTVTGWGFTEYGRKSQDLLKVSITVISEDICKEAYKNVSVVINHKLMCAGGKNSKDSCRGDSGGPLQKELFYNDNIRYVQYGIVSFGPRNCGDVGFPGVYTRIDQYMDWILDNLKP